MTRFFPQCFVQNLGPFDLLVAVVAVHAAHVLLNLLPNRPAFGMPEHRTRRMLVQVKQIQLPPQFAVIPFFRLFQPGQILLQFVFGGPGCTVNALQHFIAVIATPIGPCHFHQFEMLELAGTGYVGTTAQILECTFTVKADILVIGNTANQFRLVMLTQCFEMRHSLVARQHTTHDGLILAGQRSHALFNRRQILGREWPLVGKVVIKTVFNHRANRDLCIRKQILDRIGQQVSRGMANQLQPFWVFCCHDGQR